MPFSEDQDMIQAVVPQRPDQPLNIFRLSKRSLSMQIANELAYGCAASPGTRRPSGSTAGGVARFLPQHYNLTYRIIP
jgi:hypothetical protein